MADLFYIPYIRAVWRMLHARLGVDGRIALYGAGIHTRWLLGVIDSTPGPRVTCIVDDRPTCAAIRDIPVSTPESLDVGELDLILVSSDRWEDRLARRGRELWGSRIDVMRLYEGLPAGPYDKTDDRSVVREKMRASLLPDATTVTDKQVVLVCDQPRSREAKLGHALSQAGWDPILLYRGEPQFELPRYFRRSHRWRHEWEALRLALEYVPVVYHLSIDGDYRWAQTFLKHRPGPTVVDSYDLVWGMYTNAFFETHPDFADQVDRERFCLEQADGLCCRHREADVLASTFGYKLPDRISFPDGCWNRNHESQDRGSNKRQSEAPRKDGEWHLVYVGKLHREDAPRDPSAACGCNLAVAQALTAQGLDLHVFPTEAQWRDDFDTGFAAYRKLEHRSARFHIHPPVRADELTERLACFDLGLLVYAEKALPTGAAWSVTEEKRRACGSNKIFDYIEAGLGIVHNLPHGSHLRELLEKHDIGIDLLDTTVGDWGARLRRIDRASLRSRARQARTSLDVRRQAPGLIAFYETMGSHKRKGGVTPAADGQKECQHADRRKTDRTALV